MSDDIAAFFAARLDEDETAAREAASPLSDTGWTALDHRDHGSIIVDASTDLVAVARSDRSYDSAVAAHIARHDPARVLREIAAKRAIMKEHASSGGMYPVCSQCVHREPGTWYGDEEDGEEPPDDESSVGYPCRTVRLLGAVYGDHPDYRKEWVA